MQSVSFLASTAVLMVLAVFAVFGQLPTLMAALDSLSLDRAYSVSDVEIHLVVMLALFVLAFFAFTLSLRQFNHFCIMLGALDHSPVTPDDEIEAIARMNALGAKNFNSGIRAYYFSVATVALVCLRMACHRHLPGHHRHSGPSRILLDRAPHGRPRRGDCCAPPAETR
ncbi:DUF599 domain-containing protein [Devosia sp. A8/3-2]|nr:DUF599 domain-containing protein [Devosia sp. A8/3-2]